MKAVQKVRNFLLEFGTVLNFAARSWSNVTVVLTGRDISASNFGSNGGGKKAKNDPEQYVH